MNYTSFILSTFALFTLFNPILFFFLFFMLAILEWIPFILVWISNLENSRPTACYFQWNSLKLWSLIFRYWYIFMLVSKFCNTKAIYLLGYLFMIAWLGSWRLRGRKNVSVGHETSIPSIQKVSASSFSSRGLFFSLIWTVRPRYARSDNCPISEKKSPLLEKEVRPWPFSLGDILVSGPTEHLFLYGNI